MKVSPYTTLRGVFMAAMLGSSLLPVKQADAAEYSCKFSWGEMKNVCKKKPWWLTEETNRKPEDPEKAKEQNNGYVCKFSLLEGRTVCRKGLSKIYPK